jgi:predicted lipoprotein with Yx(FWY)xxD motif
MSNITLRLAVAAGVFSFGVFSLATAALAASMPAKTATTAKGEIFVNASGMTLYTFDKDSKGKSACNGPCAANWPPLAAEAGANGAKGWSVVKRADGSAQWAYHGKPLYTFVKDTKPGDMAGDGFLNGAWHVAKP